MKKIIKWNNSRSYPTNPIIDAYLLNCLESGIKDLLYQDTYALCEFNNGVLYKFWNANIPYAWLNEGEFVQKGNKTIYKYNGGMPTKKVMNKFYDAIYNFVLEK